MRSKKRSVKKQSREERQERASLSLVDTSQPCRRNSEARETRGGLRQQPENRLRSGAQSSRGLPIVKLLVMAYGLHTATMIVAEVTKIVLAVLASP